MKSEITFTLNSRKFWSRPFTKYWWIKQYFVNSSHPNFYSPSETRALALQPSLPIQVKFPVAFILFTALIRPATSWSEPKIITPTRGMKMDIKWQIQFAKFLFFWGSGSRREQKFPFANLRQNWHWHWNIFESAARSFGRQFIKSFQNGAKARQLT